MQNTTEVEPLAIDKIALWIKNAVGWKRLNVSIQKVSYITS